MQLVFEAKYPSWEVKSGTADYICENDNIGLLGRLPDEFDRESARRFFVDSYCLITNTPKSRIKSVKIYTRDKHLIPKSFFGRREKYKEWVWNFD